MPSPRHITESSSSSRKHFGLAQFAALLLERDLAHPGFSRSLPVGGGYGVAVGVQRVPVVPERLGKPPAQHRGRGLKLLRNADHLELAATLRGAGIILHLQRRLHGLHRDDALQVERQRCNGEFGILEFFPRFGPFALARKGQRLPQLGIMTVADHGAGEILQAAVGPADQDAADRMHHHDGGFLGSLPGLREDEVGERVDFLIHAARHVEIGEIEPRLRPHIGLGRDIGRHQRVEPGEKILRLVLAPFLDVEQRFDGGGRAFGGDVGR